MLCRGALSYIATEEAAGIIWRIAMTTVGIDCGTQRTKAVLVRDGEILAAAVTRTDFDTNKAAEDAFAMLLQESGLSAEDVEKIYITGVGAQTIRIGDGKVNEIMSAAAGAARLVPGCRCVLDLGAERNRAIRLDEGKRVQGYEVNDKCASGSGTFIEAMARVLDTTIDDFGDLALQHQKDIILSAQCVVFVESEVISLIHQNEAASDIAWGVLEGVASHIVGLTNRFGKVSDICVIGGPTRNSGLMAALEKEIGQKITVAPQAEYASAYGAALLAAE